MYETKLQKFSYLRELSKCHKSANFLKFKKTKKLSPGNGLKKVYGKFEDDRAFRSNRKRLWKMRYQKVKFHTLGSFQNAISRPIFRNSKKQKIYPQGRPQRRRVQNLSPIGQLEMCKTGFQKFSNLRD